MTDQYSCSCNTILDRQRYKVEVQLAALEQEYRQAERCCVRKDAIAQANRFCAFADGVAAALTLMRNSELWK